jgi:hypothetical protein
MPKTTDGTIALIALIAFAAWLFVGLPLLYSARASHEGTQSLWVPTDSVGLYTLVLAVFTALLAFVSFGQGALLLRADRTARVAADAAKRSADSAFAAERARFFIVIEKHNLTQVIGSVENRGVLASGENFSVSYQFKNYGKTPGVVKELTMNAAIGAAPMDPASHTIVRKDFSERMIGAGGSTIDDYYSPVPPPSTTEVQDIGRNILRFWLYGRLYYDDVFGNQQVHKFCFRSHRIGPGSDCILQPFDYNDHNTST